MPSVLRPWQRGGDGLRHPISGDHRHGLSHPIDGDLSKGLNHPIDGAHSPEQSGHDGSVFENRGGVLVDDVLIPEVLFYVA